MKHWTLILLRIIYRKSIPPDQVAQPRTVKIARRMIQMTTITLLVVLFVTIKGRYTLTGMTASICLRHQNEVRAISHHSSEEEIIDGEDQSYEKGSVGDLRHIVGVMSLIAVPDPWDT
jgi:hypothetical protein